MRIIFVHPDLGIGGAERLIVDAALALQNCGHEVVIYTSHHDRNHCFPETKSTYYDNSLTLDHLNHLDKLKVHVIGDWLPRSLFGSFHLLFAAVRSIYLALNLVILCRFFKLCDLIIADQITFHLPILRFCSKRGGVLFYCHFPDKFLAPKGGGILRSGIYRGILDWAEEWCLLRGATRILVNSKFTQNKFKEAFSSINNTLPEILYPGVDCKPSKSSTQLIPSTCKVLLSLNRFERKKNLNLAIEALKESKANGDFMLKLVVAGGFDSRVQENLDHLRELQDLCDRLEMKHSTLFSGEFSPSLLVSMLQDDLDLKVIFLPSITQECKISLLKGSTALIYTPSDEHFGIVPIEAMAQGLPVIAMNSGGPTETVKDNVTGFLCEPVADHLAEAIDKLLLSNSLQKQFSAAGMRRVNEMFSSKVFESTLNKIVNDC